MQALRIEFNAESESDISSAEPEPEEAVFDDLIEPPVPRPINTAIIDVELCLTSGSPFFRATGTASAIGSRIRSLSRESAPLFSLRLVLDATAYNGAELENEMLWAEWQDRAPLLRFQVVLFESDDECERSPYEQIVRLLDQLLARGGATNPTQTLYSLERFLARKADDGSWHDVRLAAALLFMFECLPRDRAPAEVQDVLRDEAFFLPLMELPGSHDPLLADIGAASATCLHRLWRNLPPAAQTYCHAETMLKWCGHLSLPKDVLIVFPELLHGLVLNERRGSGFDRAYYLLRLELPKEVLVTFLRHAEDKTLQFVADAAAWLITCESPRGQAAWDCFLDALKDDAALEDRCLTPLLRAARKRTHTVAVVTWRPSSDMGLARFPKNQTIQKMYEAIFELRAAQRQADLASQHNSVLTCALVEELSDLPRHPSTGIEVGCILHLFPLADAFEIVRAKVPQPGSTVYQPSAGASIEDPGLWLSLLLLYGRIPAAMSSLIAREAAHQLRRPSQPTAAARPFSDQAIIGALAKLTNHWWTQVSLEADEHWKPRYACLWRNLFELQATVAQLAEPLGAKRALADPDSEDEPSRKNLRTAKSLER